MPENVSLTNICFYFSYEQVWFVATDHSSPVIFVLFFSKWLSLLPYSSKALLCQRLKIKLLAAADSGSVQLHYGMGIARASYYYVTTIQNLRRQWSI